MSNDHHPACALTLSSIRLAVSELRRSNLNASPHGYVQWDPARRCFIPAQDAPTRAELAYWQIEVRG